MTEFTDDTNQASSASGNMTFADFGFSDAIMKGITEAGFTEPTPIQAQAIPALMEGHDIIGQALTGTGKTAAFGLPIMNKISGTHGLRFLILVPTRELAAQVSAELFKLGRYAELHTAAFTGGQSYSRQEKLLSMGIDILVATPGRLIDLIDSGHFAGISPEYIVVDEADEMLDMGFIEDVKKIFASFTGPRQTMLFSATMPRPVIELAETILKDPIEIRTSVDEMANNDIEQFFFVIEDRERIDAIVRLIDAQDVGKAMIFCRTKEETDALNIILGGRGYNVNCLHGDMEQAQRSRVMAAFRRGEIDILVATDVAARGLDVDDVTHVFNFHMPFDSRGYVHRIGRTGRAGKSGTAITLVTPREMRQLEAIKRTVGAQIENRLIPTRTEVTSMRLKKIFHELHDYKLDMDILNQVQTLSVNQDIMVLLAKLVGHELSGGADQGPEHIGLDGERLSDLLSPKPKRERKGKGDRHGRRERRSERSDRQRKSREERMTPPEEISIFETDAYKNNVASSKLDDAPKTQKKREIKDVAPEVDVFSEQNDSHKKEKKSRRDDSIKADRKSRKDKFSREKDEFSKWEDEPKRGRSSRKDEFSKWDDEPKRGRSSRKDEFSKWDDESKHGRSSKKDEFPKWEDEPKRGRSSRKDEFSKWDDEPKRGRSSKKDEFSKWDDEPKRGRSSKKDEFSKRERSSKHDEFPKFDEFSKRGKKSSHDDFSRHDDAKWDKASRWDDFTVKDKSSSKFANGKKSSRDSFAGKPRKDKRAANGFSVPRKKSR